MHTAKRRKFKFIGCEIIYREACYLAGTGPHQVDLQFLGKALHDVETSRMVSQVQQAVDSIDPRAGYETILLGYARCNNGLIGIVARDIPLVVPRAHDCITFFLGSRKAYQEHFDANPGTYYMTSGWCERNETAENALTRPAYAAESVMGRLGLNQSYEQLVEKYGQDNAEFIAQTLDDWTKNYSRMLYLEMGICDERAFIDRARRIAQQRGWRFEPRKGDWTLLQKLFFADWDDDFLIVRPGERIVAQNDESILKTES